MTMCVYDMDDECHMGWLPLVDALKLRASLATEPYKRDYILQKRPIILRSLLIVATPYTREWSCVSVSWSITMCWTRENNTLFMQPQVVLTVFAFNHELYSLCYHNLYTIFGPTYSSSVFNHKFNFQVKKIVDIPPWSSSSLCKVLVN